jgi:hypothetical protein
MRDVTIWITAIVTLVLACAGRPQPGAECVAVNNADSPNRSFIVVYKTGVDPVATTARLAKKHSFTPRTIYTRAVNGFVADFSPQALAGIRCEPEVKFINHDTPGSIVIGLRGRASFNGGRS